jgi:hypothetical protein
MKPKFLAFSAASATRGRVLLGAEGAMAKRISAPARGSRGDVEPFLALSKAIK